MHMFSYIHTKMNACTKRLDLHLKWMSSTQTLHFPSVSFLVSPLNHVLHTCTNTHSKSGYLCILAFVYLSVLPACGVTYSRVQNESKPGELEAVLSVQLRLVWLCSALLLLQLPADWHPTTTVQGLSHVPAAELVQPPETQVSQIKHSNSLSTFALHFFLTVCLLQNFMPQLLQQQPSQVKGIVTIIVFS